MKRLIKCSVDTTDRITELKQMDDVMESMRNKEAAECWNHSFMFNAIDARKAHKDVLEYIAGDDELYQEMCELYEELYKEYRHNGLRNPSSSTFNFAMQSDKAFGFKDKLEVVK